MQRLRQLLPGAILAAFVSQGAAHDVVPLQHKMFLSETRTIDVIDNGGCAALVTATVIDPTIANVSAVNPATSFGVTVSFDITASATKAGLTTVVITWTGEDALPGGDPQGPCQDVSGEIAAIQVVDPQDVSSANNQYSGTILDPVNTATGELFEYEPFDIYLDGPMPLFFERYYASYLRRSFILGDLGQNWLHNFDWSVHWVGNFLVLITDRGKVLKYTSDGAGNWTLQSTNDPTPYEILQDGQEILFHDPNRQRTYRFNAEGQLSEISDGKGNKHTVTYQSGWPSWGKFIDKVTDGLGRELRFNYGFAPIDNIWKIRSVREYQSGVPGRSVSFTYDESNAQDHFHLTNTQFQDVNGNFTQYDYSSTSVGTADWALMTRRTLPEGNTPFEQTFYTTASQFDSGKVATQKDGNNNVHTITYNNTNNTTTVTDPNAQTISQVHDQNGSLTSMTDKASNQISTGNDAKERRDSITDPRGGVLGYTFDAASGKLASENNQNSDEVQYQYSSRTDRDGFTQRDLTGIDYPDGTSETYTYDADGNLLTRTNRAGNTWTYTYNAIGQRLTATNPLGGVTTFTYNADGTMATRTGNANNTTTYGYDNKRRVNRITHPDTTFVSFVYDNQNNIASMTDEVGGVTQMTYNKNGNLLSAVHTSDNATTSYTYDNNDRIRTITDPEGNTSTRTYDSLGRLATVTDPAGNVATFGYDALDRVTSVTDPGGSVWLSTYDENGDLSSGTVPSNPATQFQRDLAGDVTSMTSPLGNVTQFGHDTNGRVTSVTDPLGGVTTYTYDAIGNVSSMTLPGGLSTSFGRDALGNITSLTDASGNVWDYEYDAQGRMTLSRDPLGNETNYGYDSRNRIALVTYPGGGTQALTYTGTGKTSTRTFSDGTTMTYGYDTRSRMTSADGLSFGVDRNGNITDSNGIGLTFDALGRPKTVTLAPSKVVTYSYDANGRLSGVSDWVGGSSTFGYDAGGRLVTETRPNGVTTTTTHDAEGVVSTIQEATASATLSSLGFTRNANGQIVSMARNVPLDTPPASTPPSLTFDAASQVATFTYDGLGRLTNDGTRTYVWDLASRLTSYTEGGNTVSFDYNAFGDVISRTEGGDTDDVVWNYGLRSLPVISKIRANSADVRYFVHTPDGTLLYSIDASDDSRHFYHYDEIGNTLFLTDDSGAISDSYAITAYGTRVASSGSFENPFTFGGKYGVVDEGNGLYIMRQRVYDSTTKRFISRDPIPGRTHPLTANPYHYAAGNPLAHIDPIGAGPTPGEVAQGTFDTASATAGGVGIYGHYVGETFKRADDVAETLSNALPANATPRDISHVTQQVKNAERLKPIARATNAVGHFGTALQVASVGYEAYKLKNALDRVSEAYGERVALAFQTATNQTAVAWEIFERKQIPNDFFYEINRERWTLKLKRTLQIIQWNLELELFRAGFDAGTDTWLNAMVAAKEMVGTFVPVPRFLWPDFLSPENNYPGQR